MRPSDATSQGRQEGIGNAAGDMEPDRMNLRALAATPDLVERCYEALLEAICSAQMPADRKYTQEQLAAGSACRANRCCRRCRSCAARD